MTQARPWAVLIWPDEYNDADDTGYHWTGEATDEDDAVSQAIAECEADNNWKPGYIDRDGVKVIEAGADIDKACTERGVLIRDLWWFMENVADDAADRQDRFFALRERVRGAMAWPPVPPDQGQET